MKKSMIAAAVVATAFAASANAGYFAISGSQYTPFGGSATNLPVSDLNAGSFSDAGLPGFDFTNGGSAGARDRESLTNTEANNIASALANGGSLSNGTLYYFGFEGSANGPGYFGFLFMGNGADVNWSVANANLAQNGVWSNMGITAFSGGGSGNTYTADQFTTTAGQAYVSIFANLAIGDVLGGATASDTNFNVSYLNFDGSNWTSVASASGISSSTLNTAMYNVPVPAPALLAGAGLVGAAALRRRMAKKA